MSLDPYAASDMVTSLRGPPWACRGAFLCSVHSWDTHRTGRETRVLGSRGIVVLDETQGCYCCTIELALSGCHLFLPVRRCRPLIPVMPRRRSAVRATPRPWCDARALHAGNIIANLVIKMPIFGIFFRKITLFRAQIARGTSAIVFLVDCGPAMSSMGLFPGLGGHRRRLIVDSTKVHR